MGRAAFGRGPLQRGRRPHRTPLRRGRVLSKPEGRSAPRDFTMLTLILPLMEQRGAYDAINFNLRATGTTFNSINAGAVNSTGLLTTISSYICPSDELRASKLAAGPNAFSQTSYFPSGGTWNTIIYYRGPTCWEQEPGNGAFDAYTAYSLSSFLDGTSNTIFVGESSRFKQDPDWFANTWSAFGYFGSALGTTRAARKGSLTRFRGSTPI